MLSQIIGEAFLLMAHYVEFNSENQNKEEYNILKYNEDFTEKFREVEKRIFMLHINEN